MACNHPYKAFWTGALTDTGKKELLFTGSNPGNLLSFEVAEHKYHVKINLGKDTPYTMVNGHLFLKDPIPLPCGRCSGCRLDRSKLWRDRLVLESQSFPERTWFVTLTYDDFHLPINGDGEPYVSKRDAQLFLKRLRKNTGRDFRYFLCSEYGEHTHRPHYHLILFGDIGDMAPCGINRFIASDIAAAWQLGLHEVSQATAACIGYVAGYCNKKVKDPYWDEYPVKPFVLMSKRPGLGADYYYSHDLEKGLFKVYGNFGGSHARSMPRYFEKLAEKEDRIWLPGYLAKKQEIGKGSYIRDVGMLNETDEDTIGFLKDLYINESLERKEKVL